MLGLCLLRESGGRKILGFHQSLQVIFELMYEFTTLFFFITTAILVVPIIRRKMIIRFYAREYKSEESKMEHVYTDVFGNRWFQYKNFLNLPPKRAIAGELAVRMASLCLDDKMFDKYTAIIREACNKKDLVTVANYIQRMEERRLLPAELNTTMSLANAFFLIEGENPKSTSDFWFKEKKKIWEQDEDCAAFFLHKALSITRDISDISQTDLLLYFQRQAVDQALILR